MRQNKYDLAEGIVCSAKAYSIALSSLQGSVTKIPPTSHCPFASKIGSYLFFTCGAKHFLLAKASLFCF
jgi:hypothetical protein